MRAYNNKISGKIDVYLIKTNKLNSIEINKLKEIATDYELKIFYKNKDEKYIFTRVAIREILGNYLNILPNKIRFYKDKGGRPYVKNFYPYFSISHSCNLIAIAISKNNLAIDIEKHKNRNIKLLNKFFYNKMDFKTEINVLERFYIHWTRHEAGVKFYSKSIFNKIDQKSLTYSSFKYKNFHLCIASKNNHKITFFEKKLFYDQYSIPTINTIIDPI